MLEVHFDNPLMKSATDTTGLRLHYTSELRQNEGGILITGVAPSTLHFIPPYQKEYKTAGYCSLNCTQEVSDSQNQLLYYDILASFQYLFSSFALSIYSLSFRLFSYRMHFFDALKSL